MTTLPSLVAIGIVAVEIYHVFVLQDHVNKKLVSNLVSMGIVVVEI